MSGKMAVCPDVNDRLTRLDPFREFFLGFSLMGIDLDVSKRPQFLLCFRTGDSRGKIIRNNNLRRHSASPCFCFHM